MKLCHFARDNIGMNPNSFDCLQVRIGEEILAIPKDEAKELFAKQTIVSGPWLKEEGEEGREPRQQFVPKYPSSRDHR